MAYNPRGKYKPSKHSFPIPDKTFDFVILTSVFTHMRANDVDYYLSEIARVMSDQATCFITYFIVDKESRYLMKKGISSFNFQLEFDKDCFSCSKNLPKSAVAYEEDFIRDLYRRWDLVINDPPSRGVWRKGDKSVEHFQDIVVAHRASR